MKRRPPSSNRTDTLCPYTTRFRAVLAHIANGMYGAIVVDPATPLPKADHEYVLVASEWYLNGDGVSAPASLDMAKARAAMPDWTTFNGYANQRSEEHTSELQSLMRISYAVFCLKKKITHKAT